jgi:hypothetical protein
MRIGTTLLIGQKQNFWCSKTGIDRGISKNLPNLVLLFGLTQRKMFEKNSGSLPFKGKA